MTIARHYHVTARPGMAAVMETELTRLADIVRAVPGCLGFELLRDIEDDHRFIFIEKWVDVEAHKGAGQHIPREAFAQLVGALAGPLDGAYLEYLKIV